MSHRWVGLLIGVWLTGAALAADVGGVLVPDNASVGGKDLVLNGAGVRSRMMFKVYVGSLYLTQKSSDLAAVLAASPRRIQLNLLRDLTADQFGDALVDGLKDNNSPAELAAIKTQTDQLVSIMKSFGQVKEKDVITLDFVDDATKIAINGNARGSIPGAAFNAALTRIWLGDKPAQADLKKSMLGG